MLTLLEPDRQHGCLSREEIHQQLIEADGLYGRWGLEDEFRAWGFPKPTPDQIYECMFSERPPIEWNRLGAFQDVSMRLIAMRLLAKDHGPTYLKGELTRHEFVVPPPRNSSRYAAASRPQSTQVGRGLVSPARSCGIGRLGR